MHTMKNSKTLQTIMDIIKVCCTLTHKKGIRAHARSRLDDEEDQLGMEEFGNSLTVRGGILTVADDFLKNDGQKFLSLMEELASRRIRPIDDEDDKVAEPNSEEDEWDDVYDDEDDDDYEDDEVRPCVISHFKEETLSEQQRMAEGRRMFQIFAAKMFEQRVLTAYREKVAQERQRRLLEEIEEEERQKELRELEKERKKQQKKAIKKQKEEERILSERKKKDEEEQLLREKQEAEQCVHLDNRNLHDRKQREAEKSRKEKEQKRLLEQQRVKMEADRARKEEEARRKKIAEERRLERERKEAEAQVLREKEEKERLERKKEKEERLKAAKKERKERKARERAEREALEAQMAATSLERAKQKGSESTLTSSSAVRSRAESEDFSQPSTPVSPKTHLASDLGHYRAPDGLPPNYALPTSLSNMVSPLSHADPHTQSLLKNILIPPPNLMHPNGPHAHQLSDRSSNVKGHASPPLTSPPGLRPAVASIPMETSTPYSVPLGYAMAPVQSDLTHVPPNNSMRNPDMGKHLGFMGPPASGLVGSELLSGLGVPLRPAPIQRPLTRPPGMQPEPELSVPQFNEEVTLRLSGLFDENDEVVTGSASLGGEIFSGMNKSSAWSPSVLNPPLSHPSPQSKPQSAPVGLESLWSHPTNVPTSNGPPPVLTHSQFLQLQTSGAFSNIQGNFPGMSPFTGSGPTGPTQESVPATTNPSSQSAWSNGGRFF